MLNEKNVNLFVCLKCMRGIIVIENSRGDVLNLKYIDRFLTNHPETEVMTYSDFKTLNKEIIKM